MNALKTIIKGPNYQNKDSNLVYILLAFFKKNRIQMTVKTRCAPSKIKLLLLFHLSVFATASYYKEFTSLHDLSLTNHILLT